MYIGSAVVNGVLSTLEQASIPLVDRGFLFGHAIFETLLILEGRIVFWNEHWQRLINGCEQLCIPVPPEAQIFAWACMCVSDNIARSGTIAAKMQLRITVTGGSSLSLWDNTLQNNEARVAMFCRNINPIPEATYAAGIKLSTVLDERPLLQTGVKGTNYIFNMLALKKAVESGSNDALLVRANGEVSEVTTAGFLWLSRNGEVNTIINDGRCLPSTTLLGLRAALLSKNTVINNSNLLQNNIADIALPMITSATRGVLPVCSIDGHTFDVASYQAQIKEFNDILYAEQIRTAKQLKQ